MNSTQIMLKNYIQQLNPRNAKIILETRLGMIDVKTNFPNKHENKICRNCQEQEETMEHFISCLTPEQDKYKLQYWDQIYQMSNLNELKVIAEHIYDLLSNNEYFKYKEI